MKILFLSRWYPYPTTNGSKLRIFNLMKGLASKHKVDLLSFVEPREVPVDKSCLNSICGRVETVTRKPFNPNSWKSKLSFLSYQPRWVLDTYSAEMKARIEQLLSDEKYDLVIASQIDMAVYYRYFRNLPALFEEAEPGIFYDRFVRSKSIGHRVRYGLTWVKHARFMTHLLPHFRACTVVSSAEKVLLTTAVPGYQSVEVVPNCVDLEDFLKTEVEPGPCTLIFTGSFSYSPNYDAMSWFLKEIYPRIQSAVPEVRLIITGDPVGKSLPPASGVWQTGLVDNVRPLIASSTVGIVPIRFGGGTRLKILEAMAIHIPVVSTTKGAEGLDVRNEENILLADSPEQFANAVIFLLRDTQLRRQIAENGFRLVREKYDCRVMIPRFLQLVERVAVGE